MKEPDDRHVHKATDATIKDLEKQIADLKGRWPAHSVPPAMLEQLDALEEELERLRGSSTNHPVNN